ncbi:MAG: ornithine cyclodeaminase family protein [Bacillota bacterium]
MLILNKHDVRSALSMRDAISAVEEAYRKGSGKEADIPLRTPVHSPDGPGIALFMPGYVRGEASGMPGAGSSGRTGTLGAKIISIFERNPLRGLTTVQAVLVLLSPDTGEVLAVMEAGTLTALRTGAGSGAATKLLANPDASVATIFGAGAQARTQLEAMACVRPLQEVFVCDIDAARAAAFAGEMEGCLRESFPSISVTPTTDIAGAVSRSDLIACATTSPIPLFSGDLVKPGAHINAIGSYTPDRRELSEGLLLRADKVVVDDIGAVLSEAGDFIIPIRNGAFSEDRIHGEVGEILLGRKPGRERRDEITVYKAVGMATLDLLAGRMAYEKALEKGLGTRVEF